MAATEAPVKGDEEQKTDDEQKKPESEGKPEPGKGDEGKADADIEAIAAQADKPDAVKNALTEERRKAKEAAEEAEQLRVKVKKYEDSKKTDQEKLEEKATTAEKERDEARDELLRYKVAYKKGLPFELASRLTGEDEKKLEEDADRLKELVKDDRKPSGDADAGKGEGGGGSSWNDEIRAQR